MKHAATIAVPELRAALKNMQRVIERRNTIPVLSTVRLTFSEGSVELMATDLDMVISQSIPAETVGGFAFCINPKLIMTICDFGDTLSILHDDEREGQMTCGDVKANYFSYIPHEDFPVMAIAKLGSITRLPEAAAVKYLKAVSSCISTEERRYYLNGVFVTKNPQDGALRMVSTDGHRLCKVDFPDLQAPDFPDTQNHSGVILPRKVVSILLGLMRPGGNDELQFKLAKDGHRMEFKIGEVVISTKLIDGTYPDYTRVIPDHSGPNSVGVQFAVSQALIKKLYRASESIGDKALKIDPENSTISLNGRHDSGLNISMPMLGGKGPAVGVNVNYLHQILSTTGDAEMASTGTADPLIVRGSDANVLHVLMPMRV
jgi:DNA polymerase-3 subunit beta